MAEITDWLQATATSVIEKAADAKYVQPFQLQQAQAAAQQNQNGQSYIPGQVGVAPAATASGFKLTPIMMVGGVVLLLGVALLMRGR